MRKIAVVSSTNNHTYSFFAPIVSCIWHKRMGFEPLVIQVGEPDLKTAFSLKFAEEQYSAKIHVIQDCAGLHDTTVAQVSRLFAACLIKDQDAYILTSDIDMLPIHHNYFNNVEIVTDNFIIYYYNAYDQHKFPICYLGASQKIWKSIMNIEEKSVFENLEQDLRKFLLSNPTDLQIWNYDELLFEKQLWNYMQDNKIIKIYRNPKQDRIDRSDWNFNGTLQPQIIDCHALRPAYDLCNFNKIMQLLGCLINPSDCEKIQTYYDIYKYL